MYYTFLSLFGPTRHVCRGHSKRFLIKLFLLWLIRWCMSISARPAGQRSARFAAEEPSRSPPVSVGCRTVRRMCFGGRGRCRFGAAASFPSAQRRRRHGPCHGCGLQEEVSVWFGSGFPLSVGGFEQTGSGFRSGRHRRRSSRHGQSFSADPDCRRQFCRCWQHGVFAWERRCQRVHWRRCGRRSQTTSSQIPFSACGCSCQRGMFCSRNFV